MIRVPYRNKDRWERRTRTPRHYTGSPLHLHQVEAGEFCAFSYDGVEIYVMAGNRQEAKQRAQAKTPSAYRQLKWRK
jgi:hypothetical protein